MPNFEMRFNSKSRSANIERVKQIVQNLKKYTVNDDGQYYTICGNMLSREIIDLYLLVEQWKGSELYVDGKIIDDHYLLRLVVDCNRIHYCNGECIFLGRWNTVFSLLNNDKLNEDEVVNESVFNVSDHPEILIEANDQYFTIKTDCLKNDFIQYYKMYLFCCPKFVSDQYIKKFDNIPKSLRIKRISYSDIKKEKEEKQENEVTASMEIIIARIGDEIESRFRKVMDEYFEKRKTT